MRSAVLAIIIWCGLLLSETTPITVDASLTQRTRQQSAEASIPVSSVIVPFLYEPVAFVPAAPWGPFVPTLQELIPDFVFVPRSVAPAPAPITLAAAALHQPVPLEPTTLEPLYISPEQLDAYAVEAGWSGESWQLMRRIIVECECSSLNVRAHNSSDPQGGSHGLAQLNGRYWFDRYGEPFELRYDPVVNLRTALKLYQERGRFGGFGGWSCADRLGIP